MSKQDKRDDIVRAARELLAEQGFHGAPMALIAERAGVGAGTIYRYFENRDVLIQELYLEIEAKIATTLQQGYSTEKPFRERLIHLGTALLRYFISFPVDFKYLEQFRNSPYGIEVRRDNLLNSSSANSGCHMFKELFQLGVEQQVFKDLPLVFLFDIFFGPLLTVARDHVLGFVQLDEVMLLRIVEASWDGIKR